MFVVFSSYFLFSIPTAKVTIDDGSLLFEAAQHPSGQQAFEALDAAFIWIFVIHLRPKRRDFSMEAYWKVMKCWWIFGEGPTILVDRKGGLRTQFLKPPTSTHRGQITQLLVKQHGLDPKKVDRHDETALFHAAKLGNGQLQLAWYLLRISCLG